MTNDSSIAYITGLLDNPERITDGDHGSITHFRQTFPFFVPARYMEAVVLHKEQPWAPGMMSAMQPYMGNWSLFCDFLETGTTANRRKPVAKAEPMIQEAAVPEQVAKVTDKKKAAAVASEPAAVKQEAVADVQEVAATKETMKAEVVAGEQETTVIEEPAQQEVVAELPKPAAIQQEETTATPVTDNIPQQEVPKPEPTAATQTVSSSMPKSAETVRREAAAAAQRAAAALAAAQQGSVKQQGTTVAATPISNELPKPTDPVKHQEPVQTPADATEPKAATPVQEEAPVAEVALTEEEPIAATAVPEPVKQEAPAPVAEITTEKTEDIIAPAAVVAAPQLSEQEQEEALIREIMAEEMAKLAQQQVFKPPFAVEEVPQPAPIVLPVSQPIAAEAIPPATAIAAEIPKPTEPVKQEAAKPAEPVVREIQIPRIVTNKPGDPAKRDIPVPKWNAATKTVEDAEGTVSGKEEELIQPVYTADYFRQQGEKVSEEIPMQPKEHKLAGRILSDEEKALMVMMSFSEWLLHFKDTSLKLQEEKKEQKALKTMWQKEKLAAAIEEEENDEIPENVFEMAVNSIAKEDGLASESLADIYIKQGKYDKAIDMYRKLSLRNPQKNTYFARKIEEVLKEKQS